MWTLHSDRKQNSSGEVKKLQDTLNKHKAPENARFEPSHVGTFPLHTSLCMAVANYQLY